MSTSQASKSFPKRAFLISVAAVCLSLVLSAAYSYATLVKLRNDYLDKTGHDISSAIDLRTRGPGRRSDLNLWQEVLDETLLNNKERASYIILLDPNGTVLASAGDFTSDAIRSKTGGISDRGTSIFLFEEDVPTPRHADFAEPSFNWRLRIGLYVSQAAFITRQAYAYLAVSAAAVASLIGLAFYLLKTLRRFLDLKAREDSEKRLAELGRMAATLAHEIRNPLGAVKGLSQLVEEELPPDHEVRPHIRTVVSEAERLERLVNDLLTFARPSPPQLSEFNLSDLISNAIEIVKSKPDNAQIDIGFDGYEHQIIISSDENGLKQALLNVLLNAAEASPQKGKALVKVRIEKDSGQVSIEVEDEGPGIGDRDPEELFLPFETTKTKGSGLGLAVSRQIIDRLGGKISLSNRAEGGARCIISIPAAAIMPQESRKETAQLRG